MKLKTLPFWLGVSSTVIAFWIGDWTGAVWLTVGIALGGWVPLYLMPWLRRKG